MTGTDGDSETDRETEYGAFRTGEGELVVYERDNPDAWLQSDGAVGLESAVTLR